jgi:hypothetical protein
MTKEEIIRNVIRWNAVMCAQALCEDYHNEDHRAERLKDASRYEDNIRKLAEML